MADIKIRKSVGKSGKNAIDDVKKIQELLNKHKSAGGYAALKVDMDCGKKTIAAITAFQSKVMGMSKADGRVDAGGKTLKALNDGAGSVTPASGGGGGGSGGSGGGGTKTKPSTGGGSGGGDKELEAVGKKYLEAGERLRAAMEKVAEAKQGIAARDAYAKALDDSETQLETIQRNLPTILAAKRRAIEEANDDRERKAAENLIEAVDDAKRCVDKLSGHKYANPLRRLGVRDCERDMYEQYREFKRLIAENLDQIARIDRAQPRAERAIKLILTAIAAARGINATAKLGLQAKVALFENGAEAAEKDMKKLKKEMDRLSKAAKSA